jgi:PhnB protein
LPDVLIFGQEELMAVKPIPDGYHSITPYLIVDGAAAALEFYKTAFGAVELFRMPMPDGKLAHSEFQIGDSRLMMGDESPTMGFRGPKSLGGSAISLCIYVDNVDSLAERAIAAGVKVLRPVQDQFYGDRTGTFEDPYGHVWTIMTHTEDVTAEEMNQRMKAMHP